MANPSPRPEGLSPERIDEIKRTANECQPEEWLGMWYRGWTVYGDGRRIVQIDPITLLALCAMAEARHAPTPTCVWTEDDDGIWHTGCGHAFFFDTDGPTENQQKFCGYCGKTLEPKPSEVTP